jgi:nitroimidazol reductase NimA-like FMN-containing flavoprotein (pyridoxamine 5'-phosphate oxidase superfamily)
MQPEIIHLKTRIMTSAESEALLMEAQAGRIATVSSDGSPSITPVNYAYEPSARRVYIHHSAKGGRLLDNLKISSRVCFEADEPLEAVNAQTGKHICDIDYSYRSVVCYGSMSLAGDEEKLNGLRLLGEKYAASGIASQSNEFEQHKLDRLVVLVIAIESVSGKCREPKPQTNL